MWEADASGDSAGVLQVSALPQRLARSRREEAKVRASLRVAGAKSVTLLSLARLTQSRAGLSLCGLNYLVNLGSYPLQDAGFVPQIQDVNLRILRENLFHLKTIFKAILATLERII